MTWTGEEKFDCFCGRPAGVMVKDNKPELICFAHTQEAALMAPLPKMKPADWETFGSPTREESKAYSDQGETEHPLVLAYFAARKRVRALIAQGFEEANPAIAIFLREMDKLLALNAAGQEDSEAAELLRCEMDTLWDDLDEDQQAFIRNFKKMAPLWRANEED